MDGEFVFSAPRDLVLCLVQSVPSIEPKLDLGQVKSDLDPASKPIYNQNPTLVILSLHMHLFPNSEPNFNDPLTNIKTPFDANPKSLAQIKVNMVHNMFYVSNSGGHQCFPGQRLSRGVVGYRERLNVRQM